MRGQKIITYLFIFLMLSSGLVAVMPGVHAAASSERYRIEFYDQTGKYINPENPNIMKYAAVRVYKITWLSFLGGFFKKQVFAGAGSRISDIFTTKADRLEIHFYWLGKDVYSTVRSTQGAEQENGTNIIRVQMPIIPAVPIENFKFESIAISSDVHEISTKFYDVKFGAGEDHNHILVKIGNTQYDMPVNLEMSTGSNSDEKAFRFLAQSTKGYVEGQEKWLIWTTGYYFSAVRTVLVGDNMLLVVWTYGYTDITGPWLKALGATALAGAALGAASGVGAVAMAGVGALATGALWAIKPDLMKNAGASAVGVVAGLFTPRYFIIQGAATGTNSTSGTVDIQNIPASGRATWQGTSYEIYSESNTLQVGFTKDWGSVKTLGYYDFEDGTAQGWTFGGTAGINSDYTNAMGHYSIYMDASSQGSAGVKICNVSKGEHVKLSIQISVKSTVSTTQYTMIRYNSTTGNNAASATYKPIADGKFHIFTLTYDFVATGNAVIYLYTYIGGTTSGTIYLDDIKIQKIQNPTEYRYIFDTQQSGGNDVVRYIFGTIPAITATTMGTNITNRYTLLGVDMTNLNGSLALSWDSRVVEISPSRIVVKTETWKETAWLLGTDDKNGFQGVKFLVVNSKWFIYRIDPLAFYYFTPPSEWPQSPGYTPFVANNTTVYIPSGWGLSPWTITMWNLNGWWQSIGTWGHILFAGLAALVIFIIILVIAPWVILLIFKVLAMIFKGIIRGVGAVAKGMGKMLGHKRRG